MCGAERERKGGGERSRWGDACRYCSVESRTITRKIKKMRESEVVSGYMNGSAIRIGVNEEWWTGL